MTISVKELGIDKLDLNDRLALVEEIWAGICAERGNFPLTEAQRRELDRRIADDDAFPDDVVTLEEVKASLSAKLKG